MDRISGRVVHGSIEPRTQSSYQESITVQSQFSNRQTQLFETRLLEGYDICEDEGYVSWLKSYHPEAVPTEWSEQLEHEQCNNGNDSEQMQSSSELEDDDHLTRKTEEQYSMYTFHVSHPLSPRLYLPHSPALLRLVPVRSRAHLPPSPAQIYLYLPPSPAQLYPYLPTV